MLKGKKILLGISGSIAAYKSATLVRLLIKSGAEVKVIMTPSSKNFITPLTLATLSKNAVLSEIAEKDEWSNHVMLGRWADIMLIAPLSCNTLSKMATGGCDNLLMAVYLSATCTVAVAPAMDEDMWLHPSTQKNIAALEQYGNKIIPVENGELASGLYGPGRMAEPENIINWLNDYFQQSNSLNGKKVLITAGPTYEPIDPVRFIGNHSTGKMGIALAESFRNRGAEVTLVLGPSSQIPPNGIAVHRIQTAQQMLEIVNQHFDNTDIAVLSAAVADYKTEQVADQKIKKTGEELHLHLVKTDDILATIGKRKTDKQILVGFALETENEAAYAKQKLEKKNADFIVMNSLRDTNAGFGFDTNTITIFNKQGKEFAFQNKSKKEVAEDIVTTIMQHS